MREKTNSFVHCKNMLEVMTKSALKSKDVDVLYCIVDTDVYVFQAFKAIKIDLEQFAAGLDIDLAEAQVIIHRKPETLAEAKQMIAESLAEFEKPIQLATEEVKADISKTEAEIKKAKETVQQLVGDVVENAIDYAAEYIKLKAQIEDLTKQLEAYKVKYGELVEEVKEELVEEVKEETAE